MSSLERLKRLMPPPPNPIETGTPERWAFVETMIGTPLPTAYKEFIATYGSGLVGHFIRIRNPFSQMPAMNLLGEFDNFMLIMADDLQDPLHHPIFPKPNGILIFGSTINADLLFWVTTGTPDEWPLFIMNERDENFDEYTGTIVDYLSDLLERKLDGNLVSPRLLDFGKLFEQIS